MHPKKGSGALTSTHRTRLSFYNNNNNNNKNPRNPPPEFKPSKTLQKALRLVDPLTFRVFVLHDIARTVEMHTKQHKCTPVFFLVHSNPLTGPDLFSTTTTTRRRTQGIHPQNSNLQNITKSLGSCGSPYAYIVFFNDIARTVEINTKASQMPPKKASGTPKSTHRTRPFFNNNNNNKKKNPSNPPPECKPSKTLQKAWASCGPAYVYIVFVLTILLELLK